MIARDEGSAAVELAILTPVILALLAALIFIADLAVARVRQRAAVRFAAWEMTAWDLSDEHERGHEARWRSAQRSAGAATTTTFGGEAGLVHGLLARGSLGEVKLAPLAVKSDQRLKRPPLQGGGFGGLLEPLGTLLQRMAGLQLPLLERFGFNVAHAGVVADIGMSVAGTALLPDLPRQVAPAPARLALAVDTWALHDGGDVPLPGTGTAFGRQVGRIALFGIAEELRGMRAGEALSWIPIELGAPVVSMAYGPPERDSSPVSCGGKDPLARTGRWENGPNVGTERDGMSPVRCFDTLPIDANGFGPGGGRAADPVWNALKRRGPWHMGCDRPGVSFPASCGKGGQAWAGVSSR